MSDEQVNNSKIEEVIEKKVVVFKSYTNHIEYLASPELARVYHRITTLTDVDMFLFERKYIAPHHCPECHIMQDKEELCTFCGGSYQHSQRTLDWFNYKFQFENLQEQLFSYMEERQFEGDYNPLED